MAPRVSVVIPVYNVGKQLETCLQSVVGQTFTDLEIVVVNDGSTDDSPQIVARFARQDPRIVIIDRPNEGVAYARKHGVEAARGEYIQYLDGDDFLEPDAIELLYRKAVDEQADMVVLPFWLESENRKKASNPTPGTYDSVSFFYSLAFCRNYWAVWSFLHKRSLYAGVHVEKGLSYGEDAYLASQLTYFARKIVVLESHPLLHYVIHSGSATLSGFSEKKARDIELYPQLQRRFYADKPTYRQVEKALANVELGAIVLLLSKRWFGKARRLALRAMEIEKQFPGLLHQRPARHYRKLLKAYARSEFWGKLMARYYLFTRKIK